MDLDPGGKLALYPFEYFDPIRRRWVRARYVADLDMIGRGHGPFRIIGPPEFREAGTSGSLTAGHLARGRRDPA